ncbi:PPR repeat [Musa troglodytarum]|uniref:PPR repeat n=1 Tax=Musa troglodytarum TaxID=320322 RepID=A0A9E7ED68_9LILI|nr:PPR repeat [Musa troglodytarum]
MVMYGQQNRLEEMHGVLDEMENFRFSRTRKTFLIMYKAYYNTGRRPEAAMVQELGLKRCFLVTFKLTYTT